jgi:hypothetical protein
MKQDEVEIELDASGAARTVKINGTEVTTVTNIEISMSGGLPRVVLTLRPRALRTSVHPMSP